MSHILKANKDLSEAQEYLSYLREKTITKDFLQKVLISWIPQKEGHLLTNYVITENGRPACFFPRFNSIHIGQKNFLENCRKTTDALTDELELNDPKTFEQYYALYTLAHEVEHAYQYLIAYQKVEEDVPNLSLAYQGIFDIFSRSSSLLPNPIKEIKKFISFLNYQKCQDNSALERNALIDGFVFMEQLAEKENREDMWKAFSTLKQACIYMGYLENRMGSFYNTYQTIHKEKEGKNIFPSELNTEDAIYYGFPIAEEEREKLLAKIKH